MLVISIFKYMLPVLAFCFDFVMSIPVFTMDPSVIPDDNATADSEKNYCKEGEVFYG